MRIVDLPNCTSALCPDRCNYLRLEREREKSTYNSFTSINNRWSENRDINETITTDGKLSFISDDYVLMWKHGDKPMAMGNNLLDRSDSRLDLRQGDNGNTLVIALAEPADAGDYECVLMSPKQESVKHNVAIRGENSLDQY